MCYKLLKVHRLSAKKAIGSKDIWATPIWFDTIINLTFVLRQWLWFSGRAFGNKWKTKRSRVLSESRKNQHSTDRHFVGIALCWYCILLALHFVGIVFCWHYILLTLHFVGIAFCWHCILLVLHFVGIAFCWHCIWLALYFVGIASCWHCILLRCILLALHFVDSHFVVIAYKKLFLAIETTW